MNDGWQGGLDVGLAIVPEPSDQGINVNIVILHFSFCLLRFDFGGWLDQINLHFFLLFC